MSANCLPQRIFVTPSGRRWLDCGPGNLYGHHRMVPIGLDLQPAQTGNQMNDGVRARYVDPARLDGNNKTWRLDA